MKVVDLPIKQLVKAPWNSNQMDLAMGRKLVESIRRFGLVGILVVRQIGALYEVLSGNQRLLVLGRLGFESAPCVVVDFDDSQARLLAQALNHIQGADDLGLRAELLREVMKNIPEKDVLEVLPDSTLSLRALSSLGEATIAEQLEAWQKAKDVRLKHFTVQLTDQQSQIVEKVIAKFIDCITQGEDGNPNRRGLALYHMCRDYLRQGED